MVVVAGEYHAGNRNIPGRDGYRMKNMEAGILTVFLMAAQLCGCGEEAVEEIRVIDREHMKLVVLRGERTRYENFYEADFVIMGGGLGGIAAALAACSSGRMTILIEETDHIGGCFTEQDTSRYLDNRFVETSGSSPRYLEFRERIREWYRQKVLDQPEFMSPVYADLGDFNTNRFCFETDAAIDVIRSMLKKYVDRENLIILRRHKIYSATRFNLKTASVQVVDLDNKVLNQVTGWMFIDATETGDVLPLVGIESVIGSESREDTGEPHAANEADSLGAFAYYYYDAGVLDTITDFGEIALLNKRPAGADSVGVVAITREPRRMKSFERIVEEDIAEPFQSGPRARYSRMSVGIGYSPIRITGAEGEPVIVATKPYQIPLTALVPRESANYISAGRTIGCTYVASSAYSARSVEWVIGESAGEFAAFCAGNMINTHEVLANQEYIMSLQEWLVGQCNIPLYWYDDVKPGDPDFVEAQLTPFRNPEEAETAKTLSFRH